MARSCDHDKKKRICEAQENLGNVNTGARYRQRYTYTIYCNIAKLILAKYNTFIIRVTHSEVGLSMVLTIAQRFRLDKTDAYRPISKVCRYGLI